MPSSLAVPVRAVLALYTVLLLISFVALCITGARLFYHQPAKGHLIDYKRSSVSDLLANVVLALTGYVLIRFAIRGDGLDHVIRSPFALLGWCMLFGLLAASLAQIVNAVVSAEEEINQWMNIDARNHTPNISDDDSTDTDETFVTEDPIPISRSVQKTFPGGYIGRTPILRPIHTSILPPREFKESMVQTATSTEPKRVGVSVGTETETASKTYQDDTTQTREAEVEAVRSQVDQTSETETGIIRPQVDEALQIFIHDAVDAPCDASFGPTEITSLSGKHAEQSTQQIMSSIQVDDSDASRIQATTKALVEQFERLTKVTPGGPSSSLNHGGAIPYNTLSDNSILVLPPEVAINEHDFEKYPHLGYIEELSLECLRNPYSSRADNEQRIKAKIAARGQTPPPPPTGTKGGYNPLLDEKRPQELGAYLRQYHVVFLIDDSGSMAGHSWIELRHALFGISKKAMEFAGGVDIQFLNSRQRGYNVESELRCQQLFSVVSAGGGTPTGQRLKDILYEHLNNLDRQSLTNNYRNIKPLDLIVITDGAANPIPSPKEVLMDVARRIALAKHHPNYTGVQFVQIGKDKHATEALQDLTVDVGNMVDTVPYLRDLTPERLLRILLGALHPNVRALIP